MNLQDFIEFFQKHKGFALNTAQELVVRILFNEPRVMELLSKVGSGKSTLFDALEAYADNKNPNYQTRGELLESVAELAGQIVELKATITKLEAASKK